MSDVAYQAERDVLGQLLRGADWSEARVLCADDFERADHRLLYAAIAELAEDDAPIDLVTVGERLEATGQLERVGWEYMGVLAADAPLAPIETRVSLVRRESRKRSALVALAAAQRAVMGGEDPAAALANAAEALEGRETPGPLSMAAVVEKGLEAADLAASRSRMGGTAGAPTGIPFVDQRTGGFQPGRVWVLAGRPGAGKSAFALQASIHAAKRGHGVALVSLEMGAPELGIRAIAQHAGVSATMLTLGDPRGIEALDQARVNELRPIPLRVDTETHQIADLLAGLASLSRSGTRVVVIDYLQRVVGGEGSKRHEQLGDITRRLKRAALRHGLCVVVVSSLNRENERDKRRPGLSDLRESGDIEYDADVVIGLHRTGLDDTPAYDVEIGILKNRTGRIGWAREPFSFDARYQRFMEPAYRQGAA